MYITEEAFDTSDKLLFLSSQEPCNLAEALKQSPGLRKLATEYYALARQAQLSKADAERMAEIFELAIYDSFLDECIDKIHESIEIIEQLESKKLALEDFIDLVETTPESEMNIEKFKELAQSLEWRDGFLENFIKFDDRNYHHELILSTPHSKVNIISWRPGQETSSHSHHNSYSLICVLQGTLTHRISKEISVKEQLGYKQLKEERVEENQWIHFDSSQHHQLINEEPNDDLITLHFRYYKKLSTDSLAKDEYIENANLPVTFSKSYEVDSDARHLISY